MSTHQDLPFMSVVICSYNGETTIGRTLDCLQSQDYPKNRFEIIVIDDGSTDKTAAVVNDYPAVRCISLPHNLGLSEARNAGLAAAKGAIYVAMDDDCLMHADWLSHLATGYALHNPAGVGGQLVHGEPVRGIVKSYVSAIGSGFAPRSKQRNTQISSLHRLYNYLVAGLHRLDVAQEAWVETEELYGANCSFPVEVLKAVGGWRKEMSGIEDRDLSLRIRKRFPDQHFYAMKAAKIIHDPMASLVDYLLRPYRRGSVNFRFHHENNLMPPLFPYPLLTASLSVAVVMYNYWMLPIALLLIPQLLYFWWPYYAVRRRKLIYMSFPYLQLAEEGMVIIGLLRGYIYHAKELYERR